MDERRNVDFAADRYPGGGSDRHRGYQAKQKVGRAMPVWSQGPK